MKLREYMKLLTSKGKEELATRVGVKKIYLHQVAGGVEPSALVAARIERETGGKVSVYETKPSEAEEIWGYRDKSLRGKVRKVSEVRAGD